jgi:hypothetical protein
MNIMQRDKDGKEEIIALTQNIVIATYLVERLSARHTDHTFYIRNINNG